MATLYSDRLYAGVIASGVYTTLFTVPAGKRYVVRAVAITNATAGTISVLLHFPVAATFLAKVGPILATDSSSFLSTRHVVPPGESVEAFGVGGAAHVVVSGYVLDI